jgi:hypothetical protein
MGREGSGVVDWVGDGSVLVLVEVEVDRLRAVIQELSSHRLHPPASYQSYRFYRPNWNEHDATVTALYGGGRRRRRGGSGRYVYTG